MNSPNSFEVHNGPTEMKLAAMRCLSEKLLEAASAAPPCVNITLPILHSGLKMEKKYNKKCEYDDGLMGANQSMYFGIFYRRPQLEKCSKKH